MHHTTEGKSRKQSRWTWSFRVGASPPVPGAKLEGGMHPSTGDREVGESMETRELLEVREGR